MSCCVMSSCAILLCAGYGTRMGELTARTPKPLLPVAGRPVLDYLLDQVRGFGGIETIHVVSNARHAEAFRRWAEGADDLVIHDDGSTESGDRLGAVGDLGFVVERLETLPGGAFVAAGDNIFRFALEPFWRRFRERGVSQVLALEERDREKLRKTGVLELAADDRVLRLHEKPAHPPSTWACPPVYALDRAALERVGDYLAEGRRRDEIGRFAADLASRGRLEAWRARGERLDIGSPESYRLAEEILRREPVLIG